MLLNGKEIKERALISGATEAGFRSASYDVHVGDIITPSGEVVSLYELPPQGMVRVVSEELLNIPEDVAGHALVKTSLCDESILAINIGLIDPRYRGPVSSALINFGKHARVLKRGEVFLRLSFFTYSPALLPVPTSELTHEEHLIGARQKVLQFYPATFLDLRRHSEETAKEIFENYRAKIFTYVAVMALVLALFTFFLNFGTNGTINWMLQRSFQLTPSMTFVQVQKQNEALTEKIKLLEERVGLLELRATGSPVQNTPRN